MPTTGKVVISQLTSGVDRLDDILGGGWPEYSFNLIVGQPGCGKTTLAHQFMFANATPERPAAYFTVLGEPTLKMLRYQQQFDFFDPAKVGTAVHYGNLTEEALSNDLTKVYDAIVARLEELSPCIVVVDSFRTLAAAVAPAGGLAVQDFVQRLAMKLTSWQATTFLLGEYSGREISENPVFTMADGLVIMSQHVHRNSMVRQIQAMKMRGNTTQPGLHTIRISQAGVHAYPRMLRQIDDTEAADSGQQISTGIPGLDEMLGGGTLRGNTLLISGPVGSGKTTVGMHFLNEGAARGEAGVLVTFEETVPKLIAQAKSLGFEFENWRDRALLKVLYVRPLDLSLDEALYTIEQAVHMSGAKRLVLDSLSGLEVALAPQFKENFQEALYRLFSVLAAAGVTILLTYEDGEPHNGMRFSPCHPISFLSHDIVLQRYFESAGELRTFMTVVKARARKHSRDLRAYEITGAGIVVGERLSDYQGVISSVPQRVNSESE